MNHFELRDKDDSEKLLGAFVTKLSSEEFVELIIEAVIKHHQEQIGKQNV